MSEKTEKKGMHYGSVETSKQLQETLAVLEQGGIRTTATIRRATRSQAVHSDIAALRKNGLLIRTHSLGVKRGRRRYGYELLGREEA
jgi:hypothetical protein